MNLEDRHAEVTAIFLAACELAPGEQRAFITRRCGSDVDLRAEVEAMLLADGTAPGFLESPVVTSGDFLDDPKPPHDRVLCDKAVPTRIGHYKLLRLLGRGGTAVVYLAEQEHPARNVALKVLRRGFTSRSAFRRLEEEARILARLQHPGIAQIFEAGLTDSNDEPSPYFAMEFVEGELLTDFAEARSLSTRQRLELMLPLCDAVEHAHQRGIIHRDLKPANILVTESAAPKVLDFGIARATDCDLRTTTLRTDIGQLIGTIPYMSPEQTLGDGDALDTRSDVYSLAVVAYELLTGRLPQQLDHKPIPEAIRIIREENPAPPSRIVATLRGDIDTILFKALEKDRNRRYQTITEFAADIRRYLQDEPIQARPPSVAYQFRKFARRNRGLVCGAAVAIVALLVGTAGTAFQAIRATRERERATEQTRNARIAEQVARQQSSFLADLLSRASAENPNFRDVTVRQALDIAAQSLEAGSVSDPTVEAALRHVIGYSYFTLWAFGPAEVHLLRERDLLTAQEEPGEAYWENARCLAQLYYRMEQFERGRPLLAEAIAGFLSALGDDHPATLRATHWDVMYLAVESSEPAAVEQAWINLAQRAEAVLGQTHEITLEAKSELGLHLRWHGQLERSEPLLREVCESREATLGMDHMLTITAMNNWAVALQDLRRYDEALGILRTAFEAHRRIWGPDHRETLICQGNLLMALRDRGHWDEVKELALDAIPRCRRAFGPDGIYFWGPVFQLARAYMVTGDYEAALDRWNELLSIQVLERDNQQGGKAFSLRGECLMKLQRFEEAEQDLLRGYAMLSEHFPPGTDHLIRSTEALIGLYDAWNNPNEAAAWRLVLDKVR